MKTPEDPGKVIFPDFAKGPKRKRGLLPRETGSGRVLEYKKAPEAPENVDFRSFNPGLRRGKRMTNYERKRISEYEEAKNNLKRYKNELLIPFIEKFDEKIEAFRTAKKWLDDCQDNQTDTQLKEQVGSELAETVKVFKDELFKDLDIVEAWAVLLGKSALYSRFATEHFQPPVGNEEVHEEIYRHSLNINTLVWIKTKSRKCTCEDKEIIDKVEEFIRKSKVSLKEDNHKEDN